MSGDAPRVPLQRLDAVWFQITGTLCNLACRHCFNASGPREPWLAALAGDTVRRAIADAEALGVRELYFTGGEPFLHRELFDLLDAALAVAPTTVLTNGTLIDDDVADRLVRTADRSPYSLEIRVSLDGATAKDNDRVRGRGSFAKALAAVQRLSRRGLYPIVTATDVAGRASLYDELRTMLLAAGVDRPRIKILPLLPLGRCASRVPPDRLTAAELDGFDATTLPCSESRAIATGGVYACPILAGLPGARVGPDLRAALGPISLEHPACVTCWETGLTCRNA
ncbi:MAG: radical SAM protein [Candidatus Rokubacteria bacterium]|nr:radical SAM protein [Candidatus Rokubacteria bacterium]